MTGILLRTGAALALASLVAACGEDDADRAAQESKALEETIAQEHQEVEAALSGPVSYKMEEVVPGSAFHGIHGITETSDGKLLAGSVLGRAIYEIDKETGDVSVYEAPPMGMADDLEEGPDGELGWTAFLDGKYYLRTDDGELRVLAEGLPGLNSTAWNAEGRLFTTQVFLGDALYELDPQGVAPPRKIMEGMGGLNGFDFGPDGKLYGPLWFKGQVARVDVDEATLEVVAEDFEVPAAVNFDSKGNLWVVDTAAGIVYRVDVETGEKTKVADVDPAIDNLALTSDDRLFITNMADNAIIEIDTETGEERPLVKGDLAVAGDIALAVEDGEEVLYVGDVFSIRKVNLSDGEVSEVGRVFASKIDYPISVAAAHGRIGVAGWSSGAVQVIEPGEKLPSPHHDFAAPTDALPLEDGSTLVAEYGKGALTRVSADWENREEVMKDLKGPANLVLGPDGMIYLSEQLAGTISRIDLETGEKTVIAKDLDGPEGFSFGANGNIFVAEVAAKRITRIDNETNEHTVLAEDLPIGFGFEDDVLPLNVPTGVAVAKDGAIYFSSDMDAGIYRLVPE